MSARPACPVCGEPVARARKTCGRPACVSEARYSPQARAKISAAAKERWADPDRRPRLLETFQRTMSAPEARANQSAAQKRRWADPEQRRKMIAALENSQSPEARARLSAAARQRFTPEYRAQHSAVQRARNGDGFSYGGAHQRVYFDRGPATDQACVICGRPASEWAFNHDTPAEFVKVDDRGRRYATRSEWYLAMDRSCHRRYDRVPGARRRPIGATV
jgi:hypothetical protein